MTAKHTTGPLTYASTVGGYGIYRADNWPIAVAVQRDDNPVRGGGIADSEAKANAVLFAAAPDLLALAHQYAEECGDCAGARVCPDDEPCAACADVWAVIDKVEGRT
jgi:hypothetical protein